MMRGKFNMTICYFTLKLHNEELVVAGECSNIYHDKEDLFVQTFSHSSPLQPNMCQLP